MALDLDLFKKHVNADDFTDDDGYLRHLLDTAEEVVVDRTNRYRCELEDPDGNLPKPLRHACYMLAAGWYHQREGISQARMHSVPDAVEALVRPYRRLSDL